MTDKWEHERNESDRSGGGIFLAKANVLVEIARETRTEQQRPGGKAGSLCAAYRQPRKDANC